MAVPVFALYCAELPEREKKLRDHLKERGVPFIPFRAIHGLTWGLETSKEYDVGKRLPPGHVALNVSSYFMWQHAHGMVPPIDEQPIIFFEDDVKLPETFQKDIDDLHDELDLTFPDWDLVFIGTCGSEPHIWHKVTERIGGPDSRLCRMADPFGTHAMMVRRRAIPVLLEHMRIAERNLDQQLWQRVLQPGHLKWCALLPTLVTQRTYDYTGGGSPEWGPSTLRPGEEPKKAVNLDPDQEGRPSSETMAATLALIDPFPCMYRGEFLEEVGRTANSRRGIPLSECGMLNRPCHAKKDIGPVKDESGEAVVECQHCNLRLALGIPEKTRPRLALPEGHFNPGMCMWKGRLILATRDSWGHSKVALWELRNTTPEWTGEWSVSPISNLKSSHPFAPRLEDPRLFVATNPKTGKQALHATFSLPDKYPATIVRVGYVQFSDDLKAIEDIEVLDSPTGNVYEKNWMPLESEGELRWLYMSKPNHIVLGKHQNWRTPNPFPWTGGVIRGGAPPVLARNESAAHGERDVYYHFFHGVLKRSHASVYTIGCQVFEANPPYRVLRQTAAPLLWPDLPAADEDVIKRCILWPGGAVPHAGAWHLSVGVDDTYCRIVRIPFEQVEAALIDVPGGREVTSIRDTHIAMGVRAADFAEAKK